MTRGEHRFRSVSSFCLVAMLVTTAASAEEPGESPARRLFKEGRELAAAGNYDAACPKFEASLQLEVGVGTQFNLADCWERIGRTASAQKLFLGAAATAKAAGQPEREQILRDRAAALEPRIPKLVIEVQDLSPRLIVKRGELPIEPEQWGRSLPLDAGKYELSAKAPGKKPWTKSIEIQPGATILSVEVPKLEPETPEPAAAAGEPATSPTPRATPVPPAAPATSDRASSGAPSAKVLVLGGIGVLGVGFGTVMGLRYKSANDDAQAICPSNRGCTTQQIEDHDRLVEKARTGRAWFYVGTSVGVASLAAAAAFYVLDRPARSTAKFGAAPLVGASGELGGAVVGSF